MPLISAVDTPRVGGTGLAALLQVRGSDRPAARSSGGKTEGVYGREPADNPTTTSTAHACGNRPFI